jgi:CRISPR/Cas system-associated endonuclease Cas1
MEYFHRGRETAFDLSIEIIEMIKSSIDREVVNADTLGAP